MTMKYYLFMGLTIVTILSQIPHAWYTFDSFSRLTGTLKKVQSILFCSILSVAIFAFVWIGKPQLALAGAFIEIVINIYYYTLDFWQKGITVRVKRRQSILRFWRINWIKIFFGVLLPILIYVFSEQMRELI